MSPARKLLISRIVTGGLGLAAFIMSFVATASPTGDLWLVNGMVALVFLTLGAQWGFRRAGWERRRLSRPVVLVPILVVVAAFYGTLALGLSHSAMNVVIAIASAVLAATLALQTVLDLRAIRIGAARETVGERWTPPTPR